MSGSVPPENLLQSFLVGTSFQAFLTGIGTLQTIHYVGNFDTFDNQLYQAAVWALLALGLLHQAATSGSMYVILTRLLSNPTTLNNMPWPFPFTPGFTGVTACLVQTFYVYRIFILSKGSWIIPSGVIMMTSASLAVSLYCTIYYFQHPHWSDAQAIKVLEAKADIERTNSIILRIILLIVTSNTLVCTPFSKTYPPFVHYKIIALRPQR